MLQHTVQTVPFLQPVPPGGTPPKAQGEGRTSLTARGRVKPVGSPVFLWQPMADISQQEFLLPGQGGTGPEVSLPIYRQRRVCLGIAVDPTAVFGRPSFFQALLLPEAKGNARGVEPLRLPPEISHPPRQRLRGRGKIPPPAAAHRAKQIQPHPGNIAKDEGQVRQVPQFLRVG